MEDFGAAIRTVFASRIKYKEGDATHHWACKRRTYQAHESYTFWAGQFSTSWGPTKEYCGCECGESFDFPNETCWGYFSTAAVHISTSDNRALCANDSSGNQFQLWGNLDYDANTQQGFFASTPKFWSDHIWETYLRPTSAPPALVGVKLSFHLFNASCRGGGSVESHMSPPPWLGRELCLATRAASTVAHQCPQCLDQFWWASHNNIGRHRAPNKIYSVHPWREYIPSLELYIWMFPKRETPIPAVWSEGKYCFDLSCLWWNPRRWAWRIWSKGNLDPRSKLSVDHGFPAQRIATVWRRSFSEPFTVYDTRSPEGFSVRRNPCFRDGVPNIENRKRIRSAGILPTGISSFQPNSITKDSSLSERS